MGETRLAHARGRSQGLLRQLQCSPWCLWDCSSSIARARRLVVGGVGVFGLGARGPRLGRDSASVRGRTAASGAQVANIWPRTAAASRRTAARSVTYLIRPSACMAATARQVCNAKTLGNGDRSTPHRRPSSRRERISMRAEKALPESNPFCQVLIEMLEAPTGSREEYCLASSAWRHLDKPLCNSRVMKLSQLAAWRVDCSFCRAPCRRCIGRWPGLGENGAVVELKGMARSPRD